MTKKRLSPRLLNVGRPLPLSYKFRLLRFTVRSWALAEIERLKALLKQETHRARRIGCRATGLPTLANHCRVKKNRDTRKSSLDLSGV